MLVMVLPKQSCLVISKSILFVGITYKNTPDPMIGGPGVWWGACQCEASNNCATPWNGHGLASVRYPLNSDLRPYAADGESDRPFSSFHPGGAGFAFVDGHVEFLNDSISFTCLSSFSYPSRCRLDFLSRLAYFTSFYHLKELRMLQDYLRDLCGCFRRETTTSYGLVALLLIASLLVFGGCWDLFSPFYFLTRPYQLKF